MARTITEIKKGLTTDWMADETVAGLYKFNVGDDFDTTFSKVSIENLLFYIFSVAAYVLETLFDTHKTEVNTLIENILPHRPKWYKDKAVNFMVDCDLLTDSDEFDTTGMTDAKIAAAKVVTYATAVEETGSSVLLIKVATEKDGVLQKLSDNVLTQFTSYMNQIKDAGVALSFKNLDGDAFSCKLDIYYDPILLKSDIETTVKAAIKAYITGLPFNGEYSNMALIDAIQAVDGVKIAELKSVQSGTPFTAIDAKTIPAAGYFSYVEGNITLNPEAYGN